MGCLAKFYMMQDYRREGATYEMNANERVLYEGIFVTSSIATGQILIKMVEEYVFTGEPPCSESSGDDVD